MVLHKVKEIGRCHLIQIIMKIMSLKPGLRSGDRRFEQPIVTDTQRSTVPFNFRRIWVSHG